MTVPNKVLVFAASGSSNSINKMLATHAVDVLKKKVLPNVDTTIHDLNDFKMPIFSVDRESEG